MKGTVKIATQIALCCIIVGAVFLAVGYANMDSVEQYYKVDMIELNESVSSISGISEVYIDVGMAEVEVVYEGDIPSIQGVVHENEEYEIYREGDTLVVRVKNNSNKWYHNIDLFNYQYYDSRVTIRLPEKWKYDDMYVRIDIGMGSVEMESIHTDKLDLNVDMGTLNLNNVSANTVTADCGLGSIYLSGMIFESCELSCEMGTVELSLDSSATPLKYIDAHVGMGSIILQNINADDVVAECDSGVIEISGKIENTCDLICGMGSITLRLNDSDESWCVEQIEIGMGSVTYAGRSYDGLGRSFSLPGGGKSMKIDVDMGTIDVSFGK